ncbi:MAG: cAMP-activated global transcriptional regulator CRP [Gammaproteobacteria bacterium]|nr:cAMP-activated global transcriptional regulator CRP [Gammaproteobacteria bacterium]
MPTNPIQKLENTIPQLACKIDPSAIQKFLSHCTLRSIPKKSIILRPGDPADRLFFIIKGTATVILEDEDDGKHEIVLTYLNQGDFIGEIGLFYKIEQRSAIVRTKTECEVAEIGYQKLRDLFENELKDVEPHILNAVGIQLSQRLMSTSRKVGQLAFMDVYGRIARTLLDMCKQPDAMSHPQGTQLHISRQEIGRIVGCSREMAGRVLKNMGEENLIEVAGMKVVVFHER